MIINYDGRIAVEENIIVEIKDKIIIRNEINPNSACIIGWKKDDLDNFSLSFKF